MSVDNKGGRRAPFNYVALLTHITKISSIKKRSITLSSNYLDKYTECRLYVAEPNLHVSILIEKEPIKGIVPECVVDKVDTQAVCINGKSISAFTAKEIPLSIAIRTLEHYCVTEGTGKHFEELQGLHDYHNLTNNPFDGVLYFYNMHLFGYRDMLIGKNGRCVDAYIGIKRGSKGVFHFYVRVLDSHVDTNHPILIPQRYNWLLEGRVDYYNCTWKKRLIEGTVIPPNSGMIVDPTEGEVVEVDLKCNTVNRVISQYFQKNTGLLATKDPTLKDDLRAYILANNLKRG